MSDQELARDLGFLEAYTLGLGTMIGAGIFVLPGIVAGNAGPASMISFLIGGVVALLAALSLSELATGMPKAGGSYYYVNQALGGFFGSIVGWGMWAGLMFATAFYMLGFGQYLIGVHGIDQTTVVAGSAMIMAAVLVLVNFRGVKETGSLQNIIVIVLVGLIIVFISFGLSALNIANLEPFAPEGWGAVGLTAGTVFVTFIGFEVIATSAEEIKNPGRNLPLSMIAAVVTPTILYVLVMLVSTGVVSIDVLEASPIPVADVAAASVERFGSLSPFGLFTISIASVASSAMILGAVLATVSSANASILSAARVNFAMGRDRILSEWLNEIHGKFRTPYRAILATGAVILVLIALPVNLDLLADVAAFSYLVTYTLVHIAVVVMRRADPPGYDPEFTIPRVLYPAVPIVGALACVVVMVQMRTTVQLIGAAIIAVGILWYVGYGRDRSDVESLLGEAVAPTDRAETTTDRYTVVVPVANPNTQQDLLAYAAASAAGHERVGEVVAVNVNEVPPQTSLAQEAAMEAERVENQRTLLTNAQQAGENLDVAVRTRAIVGRNTARVLLDVITEEDADHVLLGWAGERSRRDFVFGSTLDPVVERAPCEVTLVSNPGDVSDIVVLAGAGTNTPAAARRGVELSRAFDTNLRLLNVQQSSSDPAADDPEEVGYEMIQDVAAAAGIADAEYSADVRVSDTVRQTILTTVTDADTVCVGATGEGLIAQTLYGSIPQAIATQSDGTILMTRSDQPTTRSLREAVIERLGGRTD